jgi:acyl-coenzyme A thioesterase PaaI-like protein
MGWAPCVVKKRFCVAVELRVRFLKPALIGMPLIVRGEMVADRGRLWDARGDIRDERGQIYARGTGVYYPLSPDETQRIMDTLRLDGRRLSLAEALDEA